jgi:uncharacterized protein (DUF1778 family)
MDEILISASISETTKQQLERYAEVQGVEQSVLVEDALLHHLQALRELPAEILIRPRLELSEESFTAVMDRLEHPRPATQTLLDLVSVDLIDEDR